MTPPDVDGHQPATRSDPLTRAIYATDNSIYQVEPAAVALPRSADEVQRLVADEWRRPDRRALVARGGGTGTNGQSLTDGLVVDVKRHLNRVLAVDPDAGTAVVEPGVVTAALNAELATNGLFWAPHTSTLNRATVGGMIATDAAGKGSLVHGRAHRHVLGLDVVLDDGTPWRAEPVPVAEATERARVDDRVGRLWRDLLALPIAEGDRFGLPELARGFSGYGIDRFRHDGLVDPIALLCGAEGTLAVTTAATIRLTRKPKTTVLVVAGYDSFADALDDAVELAAIGPSAIETFDETTLDRGRSSPAWPALGSLVNDDVRSVLLLEFTSDRPASEEPVDVAGIERAIRATGRARTVRAADDPAKQAGAWKVRADAVGLLAKVATRGPGTVARPTAFVEDCAVPVSRMTSFIAGFRNILDDAGLTYGMFGHADVGCVHVRPALDLTDPAHEKLVRTITERVVDLVADHGGVLWGEHGRGFRGESASTFLDPATVAIMERVKAAFDPQDRFNPGKLYRPAGSDQPLIGVDEPGLRGQANRAVPVAVRTELADAFACNGNGLCHHHDAAEVMCPSYKATGDPALSPRGRADLIRAWAARRATGAKDLDAFEESLAANLDRCLSCSACTGRCPVEVDIPELKSQFFSAYHERRSRPRAHRLLSRFEDLAMAAARVGTPIRGLTGPPGRLLGLVDLPAPQRRQTGALPRFRAHRAGGAGEGFDVVILPDVFSAALDPAVERLAAVALEAVGLRVALAPFAASGKFDHVKGQRQRFARAVENQERLVRSVTESGAVPVVVEPAIALLHHHEYPATRAGYPRSVRHLVELLDERRDRLAESAPAGEGRAVTLLGHCTERATAPEVLAAWARVLEATGHRVVVPDIGCCGMAGIFGHEVGNQELSRRLWDLTWAGHLGDVGGPATVVATGFSCRSQAKRFAGRRPPHPVELLSPSPET
ncbi:MAG: FAD-binding and (Fe-S)-binding domain-containing protein [Actinomycetota bacterium]